ncbi:hypothetical protein KW790_00630 [Candidatus Parcubacteria bacterium]|nr:hypothetical protein [Candidatus Parcubacteria bacterium]
MEKFQNVPDMNELPLSNREAVASHYREAELNNLTDGEKEILKNSNLKFEMGEKKYSEDGLVSDTLIVSGEVEGHKILITRETAPQRESATHYHRMAEIDGERKYVPETWQGPADSVNDKYSGEMDGDPLSEAEAEELWKRYNRVAAATTQDQKLADFSKE